MLNYLNAVKVKLRDSECSYNDTSLLDFLKDILLICKDLYFAGSCKANLLAFFNNLAAFDEDDAVSTVFTDSRGGDELR